YALVWNARKIRPVVLYQIQMRHPEIAFQLVEQLGDVIHRVKPFEAQHVPGPPWWVGIKGGVARRAIHARENTRERRTNNDRGRRCRPPRAALRRRRQSVAVPSIFRYVKNPSAVGHS